MSGCLAAECSRTASNRESSCASEASSATRSLNTVPAMVRLMVAPWEGVPSRAASDSGHQFAALLIHEHQEHTIRMSHFERQRDNAIKYLGKRGGTHQFAADVRQHGDETIAIDVTRFRIGSRGTWPREPGNWQGDGCIPKAMHSRESHLLRSRLAHGELHLPERHNIAVPEFGASYEFPVLTGACAAAQIFDEATAFFDLKARMAPGRARILHNQITNLVTGLPAYRPRAEETFGSRCRHCRSA